MKGKPGGSIDIFGELQKLARRLGVVVRVEPFEIIDARGGICRVNGVPTILVPASLPLLDKIGVLSEALGRFNLEVLYVPPIIRRRISRQNRARPARIGSQIKLG